MNWGHYTYSFKPARISRITLYESSGLTSLSSWKPRDNMLSDSISRASISSVIDYQIIGRQSQCFASPKWTWHTFWMVGRTTSSTSDRPALAASLAARLCAEENLSFTGDVVGDVVKELEPLRMFPTYSDESRKEPEASIFFTGRIVSTPVPISASRTMVPFGAVRAV